VDAVELPAFALRVVDGFVGIGNGTEQLKGCAVGLAVVFVKGHA